MITAQPQTPETPSEAQSMKKSNDDQATVQAPKTTEPEIIDLDDEKAAKAFSKNFLSQTNLKNLHKGKKHQDPIEIEETGSKSKRRLEANNDMKG